MFVTKNIYRSGRYLTFGNDYETCFAALKQLAFDPQVNFLCANGNAYNIVYNIKYGKNFSSVTKEDPLTERDYGQHDTEQSTEPNDINEIQI